MIVHKNKSWSILLEKSTFWQMEALKCQTSREFVQFTPFCSLCRGRFDIIELELRISTRKPSAISTNLSIRLSIQKIYNGTETILNTLQARPNVKCSVNFMLSSQTIQWSQGCDIQRVIRHSIRRDGKATSIKIRILAGSIKPILMFFFD